MLEHLKFVKGDFQELFPSHLPKIQQYARLSILTQLITHVKDAWNKF